jgi:hypothetical protein
MVADAPRVLEPKHRAQALNRPLELKLTQPDEVFRYEIQANGKSQPCAMSATRLRCSVDKLGLQQGASYTLSLQRRFNGKAASKSLPVSVSILPSVKVLGASVKPEELVYTKPRNIDITLDKSVTKVEAKLEFMDGGKLTPVSAQVRTEGPRVLLAWSDDLPREKDFRLTLAAAAGSDGSVLEEPYSLRFRTSGGPRVLGVSIGSSSVAPDARAVVTFDQPLAADADIAHLAGIGGGGATISRQGSSQVAFALRNVPHCGAFSLTIAKGLMSAGGVPSSQSWSYGSRVTCRTTRTIGYSVRGRPIQAYFYGSGPSTVLFTGGIHGDEPSGVYIMQDWAAHLDANAYKIPAGRQVVVVPNLNPDGIASGQRYNAHNVNIDRNFPSSDWISDIGLGDGRVVPKGGGAVPLSEPETQAIANLTSSLQLRAEYSFHSQGALVGANKVADSVALGSRYAASVGYGTMFYNPEQIMGYTLTGEYEIWIGEKFGAPAVLIELPTHTGRYFSRHLNVLWTMVGA